jgi:esterase/lipase superfamily enzyme
MIIVSTRKNFIDADHICENRVIKEIELVERPRDIKIPEESLNDDEFLEKLSGNKILIIVHGYNNTFKKIIKTYRKITAELGYKYDHIIGFAWAGGNHIDDFYRAKRKVDGVGDELRDIIDLLNTKLKTIDIMVHKDAVPRSLKKKLGM